MGRSQQTGEMAFFNRVFYLFSLYTCSVSSLETRSVDTIFSDAYDPRNFTEDPWLPAFHFVPYPFDWLNDPNGPCYDPVHQMYHLFYQYKTPREWGHAVSPNLIDWIQLPVALDLNAWYDSGGDFSGSASVLDDDYQTVVLTVSSSSGHIFTATAANRSDPYLQDWVYSDDKDAQGASQPIFTPTDVSRDPTELIALGEGGYQMFVGSLNGTALWQVDSSDELYSYDSWYMRGLAMANTMSPDDPKYSYCKTLFWECPDVFKLSLSQDLEVWVSKFSLDSCGDYFYTGVYDTASGLFTAGTWDVEQPQRYDTNDLFYASKTFYDPINDRRVLWGWLHMQPWPQDPPPVNTTRSSSNKNLRSQESMHGIVAASTGSWQNAMSLPRAVNLANQGASLTTYPIPELETLRDASDHHTFDNLMTLTASGEVVEYFMPLDGVSGTRLDISLQVNRTIINQDYASSCGLRLYLNTDDDSQSGYLDVMLPFNGLEESENGLFRPMRVLVDGSIVEVFYDGGDTAQATTSTYFHYPNNTANNGVAVLISSEASPHSPSIFPFGKHLIGGESDARTDEVIATCEFTDIDVWGMTPFKFDASIVA